MNKGALLLALAQSVCGVAAASEVTRGGIALDVPWRANLYHFVEAYSTHTAWGLAHSERDYLMSLEVAKEEHMRIDPDVLFAAAFLHDLGAQEPFAKNGVKHEPRAVQVMEPILKEVGFPMEKRSALTEVILRHMHYAKPGTSPEAIVFRDADTLDGLGAIGAMRVFSTAGNPDGWSPTLKEGLRRIIKWQDELPRALSTATARKLAEQRVKEMRYFLERLQKESIGGLAL